MRCALIDSGGLVNNVILCDPGYDPPNGLELIELDDASPVTSGWTHIGGEWVEPAPVEPVPPPPTFESRIQAQVDELSDLTMEMLDQLTGM